MCFEASANYLCLGYLPDRLVGAGVLVSRTDGLPRQGCRPAQQFSLRIRLQLATLSCPCLSDRDSARRPADPCRGHRAMYASKDPGEGRRRPETTTQRERLMRI